MNQYDTQDLIARLIQWKASIGLMNRVYRTGKVNFYSLLVDKQFFAHRATLVKRYENTIAWVAQNLPGGVTSCWGCEKNAPQIQSLKS